MSQKYPVPQEPPSPTASPPPSAKFLCRAARYPYAEKVKTCLSFAGWEPDEVERVSSCIRKSAQANPGNFIYGAGAFPRDYDDQLAFWTVAGFSYADAVILSVEAGADLLEEVA